MRTLEITFYIPDVGFGGNQIGSRVNSDWMGKGLWWFGKHRNRCPGVWTRIEQQTSSLLRSQLSVPLRFLMLRNLMSVLDGWLDAPSAGPAGLTPLFWDFVYGFDDIPHSFSPAGPRGALYRCSGRPCPLSQFGPTWTVPLTKHTLAYTCTLTHRFSKYPNGPHFFNIYCLQFNKKNV